MNLVALLALLITANWEVDRLDTSDLDATFATVFAKLPNEVTVFPSENYYYWQIETVGGDTVWGNLRLAAHRRDHGELSFAAGERHKVFTAKDGVEIERLGALRYAITFRQKRVLFHLNRLVQEPPKEFALRADERFVQRTYDESGIQFILLYNSRFKNFLWVLNDEGGIDNPEKFEQRGSARIGTRSGFVFWQQGDRKMLAAVSAANINSNNYFDGPFDQLADNDAKETGLKKFLIDRDPDLANQIDDYGNYKNRSPATRVALSNYLKYETVEDAVGFIQEAVQSKDPLRYISGGQRSRTPTE